MTALPSPSMKTDEELFSSYAQALRADFPAESAMADQLLETGPMKQWVVLTPVLATTDIHHLERYVAQYAKQEKLKFTVVLFPNASLTLDPKQEAVVACVKEISRLQALYPALDLRYVMDTRPPKHFTSIGAIRRRLWDAAVLASHEQEKNISMEELKVMRSYRDDQDVFSTEDIIPLASGIYREPVFFNHDVDLVYLPKKYMWELAWQVCRHYFFAERKNRNLAFSSRAKHGRMDGFPNANAVVALYDNLIASVGAGFEASLVIPGYTYTSLGGFNPKDCTYEVAGFMPKKATMHIPHVTLVTDQRRFNSKLHDTSVALLWGEHTKGTALNFSDEDECRSDSPQDIMPERRDELILEFDRVTPMSEYLFQAAINDSFAHASNEEYERMLSLYAPVLDKAHRAVWEEWEASLTTYIQRRATTLRHILQAGGFTKRDELMLKTQAAVEVAIANDREYFLKKIPSA